MKAGQVFILGAYPNIFAKEADIVDVWQAHTDGDHLSYIA
jgi:hypothetical protein